MGILSCFGCAPSKKNVNRASVEATTVPVANLAPPPLIRRISMVVLGITDDTEIAVAHEYIVDVLEKRRSMLLSPVMQLSPTKGQEPDIVVCSVPSEELVLSDEAAKEAPITEKRRSRVIEAMSNAFSSFFNHFDSPTKDQELQNQESVNTDAPKKNKKAAKNHDDKYKARSEKRKKLTKQTQEKILKEKQSNPVNRIIVLSEHL